MQWNSDNVWLYITHISYSPAPTPPQHRLQLGSHFSLTNLPISVAVTFLVQHGNIGILEQLNNYYQLSGWKLQKVIISSGGDERLFYAK